MTASRFLLVPVLLTLILGTALAEPPVAEKEQPAAAPAADGPSDQERDEVKAMVAELRSEASRIRNLEWKFDVEADLLSRDQLRANMVEMVKEELKPEELERDTRILRRVGLLADDEDPLKLALDMMQEMVGGYYNPKTKKLYLIQGLVGEGQKPVVLHELIHALEDQYIDLEKRMKEHEDDSDRTFAVQCIGEGSAEHARVMFQSAHPGLTEAYLKAQQNPDMMRAQMKVLRTVPAFMIVPTLLHYDLGPKLVDRVVGEDYPGGIEALWADGPVSQEQFLHPAKWLAEKKDYPQKVVFPADLAAAAGEGWEKHHEITSGELDMIMLLDFFLGRRQGKLNVMGLMQGKYYADEAAEAAKGWDGNRSLFLRHEGKPLIWIDAYAFDTEADAGKAAEALYLALEKRNADAFVGGSWTAVPETEGMRVIDYAGVHGPGRLAQQGERIFLMDGAEADVMARLWPRVLETRFEKDARDLWDPSQGDPALDGLDLVNEEKGVGLKLPEGWEEGEILAPNGLLGFEKEGVKGVVMLQPIPPGIPLSMILPTVEEQLKTTFPAVKTDERATVQVFGKDGYRYPLGKAVGTENAAEEADVFVLYLGQAPKGILMFRYQGKAEKIEALQEEMDAIAREVVVVD